MPVYIVAAVTPTDEKVYAEYAARAPSSLTEAGGKALAVDDHPLVLEGECPGRRIVILEFQDEQAAQSWHASQKYAEARAYRARSAHTPFLLIAHGLKR